MKKGIICEALRKEVIETANLLPAYNLVWMAGGTACARDPETGYIVVTPSGLAYKDLTPEDMIIVDIDMHVIEGDFRPSVATNLWTAIFKARPDVHAIIHTHSPYASAFSVIDEPIPIITETQADWFGQPIRVAPYAHLEDDHFVSAPLEALGDGYAFLFGQHGPVTVGKNLTHALERAVTLEEAAKTYYIAKNIGNPIPFTDEQAKRSFDYYMNRYGQKSKAV
jgi:L-ribulose-5-phosphate 4-epimerase